MAGKSNRARRRRASEVLPVDIDKLLDPMRAEIAKLNREYLAKDSRSKKKKRLWTLQHYCRS